MPKYTVELETVIEANTPFEAAKTLRAILNDVDIVARQHQSRKVFTVNLTNKTTDLGRKACNVS